MFWPRPTLLRPLLTVSNIFLWCSAAIVLFIMAFFVQKLNESPGAVIIMQLVIAAGTILSAVVGLMLSTRSRYRGRMMPVNLVLSYLWLLAALLATLEREVPCKHQGTGSRACHVMRVVEAFSWIAFAFTLVNIVLESLLYGWHLVPRVPNVPDVVPPTGTTPLAPLTDKVVAPAAGVGATAGAPTVV